MSPLSMIKETKVMKTLTVSQFNMCCMCMCSKLFSRVEEKPWVYGNFVMHRC